MPLVPVAVQPNPDFITGTCPTAQGRFPMRMQRRHGNRGSLRVSYSPADIAVELEAIGTPSQKMTSISEQHGKLKLLIPQKLTRFQK